MRRLDANWLTQGLIDFEYKKYIVLAYLKDVDGAFKNNELYPYFDELISHYRILIAVRDNKELLKSSFPKEMSDVDIEKLKLTYRCMAEDDELMEEIESIIRYAIHEIKGVLEYGKEIYEWVESCTEISRVGIAPLRLEEGYVFFSSEYNQSIKIYRYQLSVFQGPTEKFRGLHTQFVMDKRQGFETLESIKLSLAKMYVNLPNPAVYAIHSTAPCAFMPTLFPVAKRMLVKTISTAA